MESNDPDQMKEKIETLKQASYKLAEEIYKNVGQNAQGGQAGGEQGPQDESRVRIPAPNRAEDVDYRVVDEDEKK